MSIICSERILLEKVMDTTIRPQLLAGVGPIASQDVIDPNILRIPCDGKVCRICLTTEGEMHSMTDSAELNETYETLTGILTADEEHLPRYLCTECADRLTNCALLRCKSLRAHLTLLDIYKRHGRVTAELVQSIEISNTLISEPVVALVDDDIIVPDKEILPVNKDIPSVTTGQYIDSSRNTNNITSEVDDAGHSINNEERANVVNVINIKKEKDLSNQEDLTPGTSNVKIEITVDNDINQDYTGVTSLNLNKDTVDVDTENDIVDLDVSNKVTCNNKAVSTAGQKNDTRNVLKTEYIAVDNVVSVKVEKLSSDDTDGQPSFVPVGEEMGDPLRIRAKELTRPQDLTEVRTDNQYTVVVYTDEKPYSCVCKMAFKFKHELESHLIKAHSDANLYSCDVCKESFKKKSHLKSHLVREHPGRKPYSCDVCKKMFKHQYQLKSHAIMHSDERPYSCPVCNKALRRKGQLRLHYISQHSNVKPYVCEICNKCFSEKRGLKLHATMHSAERPHSCHICKRKYKCKNSLRLHLITHNIEKPYSCHVCNKSFILKNVLKSHLITHTNVKPYTCQICKKPLKSKSSVRSHIAIHSGERPYSCEICQKAFYYKFHLDKHVKKHSDEKPYTCDVCKKSLKTKRTLRAHVATHYDGKSYSCDLCKRVYRQKRFLESHLLRDACFQ